MKKKSRFVFYSCFPLPPPVPVLFPILPGSCPLSPLPHTRLVFPKKCFQGYPLKTFLRTRKSISMKLLNTQHSSIPLMNVTLFYKQLLSVFFYQSWDNEKKAPSRNYWRTGHLPHSKILFFSQEVVLWPASRPGWSNSTICHWLYLKRKIKIYCYKKVSLVVQEKL